MDTKAFNRAMGRVVREIREHQGLSQSDVALVLGVSYQQVSKAEHGANAIAACYLPKLAELFGVSVAELYARSGVRNAYSAGELA